MRYIVNLSYDGAKFYGWQIQSKDISVQQSLQKSLSTLTGNEISIVGAGRTDSQVNAINYIAHFDMPNEIDARQLSYKLNAILPSGIVVHSIEKTDDEFHARFGATLREYKYFINRKRDPFVERFSYRYTYNIDVEAMNKAAELLIGRKDFSCFQKIGSDNKTSVCTVFSARWEEFTPDHVRLMGYPACNGDYLVFTISADRFLRNMVRAIVGTLLEIGRGKHTMEWMNEVLDSGSRSSAGDSVPGHALFLTRINY